MNKNKLIIIALSVITMTEASFADTEFLGHTKESICAGRTAKFIPRSTVRVKFPDTRGMPIDLAARKKADRLELVRNGLKYTYYSHDFTYFNDRQEKDFRESVILETQPAIDYLTENYTFRFPIEILKKVFKADEQTFQHYGYDYETNTWRASKAINAGGKMWSEYLRRMTTVTETAGQNGNTVFTVSLDLNLFCQTAVSNQSLISK